MDILRDTYSKDFSILSDYRDLNLTWATKNHRTQLKDKTSRAGQMTTWPGHSYTRLWVDLNPRPPIIRANTLPLRYRVGLNTTYYTN